MNAWQIKYSILLDNLFGKEVTPPREFQTEFQRLRKRYNAPADRGSYTYDDTCRYRRSICGIGIYAVHGQMHKHRGEGIPGLWAPGRTYVLELPDGTRGEACTDCHIMF